jgi:hypothetical protein
MTIRILPTHHAAGFAKSWGASHRHPALLALLFRKDAVLQVVPGKGDAFDVKIVDHQVERQKDGKLAKRTITEIWSWAAGEQRYMKR